MDLMAKMDYERYTLLVMYPSSEVPDIVVCNGKKVNGVGGQAASGYESGLVALSTSKVFDRVTYVTPGSTAS
jgi:hypothetical protein